MSKAGQKLNAKAQRREDAEKSKEKDGMPGILSHFVEPVIFVALSLFLMSSGLCAISGTSLMIVDGLRASKNYWNGNPLAVLAFLIFIFELVPLLFSFILIRHGQHPVTRMRRFFAFHRERRRIEKLKVHQRE